MIFQILSSEVIPTVVSQTLEHVRESVRDMRPFANEPETASKFLFINHLPLIYPIHLTRRQNLNLIRSNLCLKMTLPEPPKGVLSILPRELLLLQVAMGAVKQKRKSGNYPFLVTPFTFLFTDTNIFSCEQLLIFLFQKIYIYINIMPSHLRNGRKLYAKQIQAKPPVEAEIQAPAQRKLPAPLQPSTAGGTQDASNTQEEERRTLAPNLQGTSPRTNREELMDVSNNSQRIPAYCDKPRQSSSPEPPTGIPSERAHESLAITNSPHENTPALMEGLTVSQDLNFLGFDSQMAGTEPPLPAPQPSRAAPPPPRPPQLQQQQPPRQPPPLQVNPSTGRQQQTIPHTAARPTSIPTRTPIHKGLPYQSTPIPGGLLPRGVPRQPASTLLD
ncbi:hypothetical protein VP01_2463g1 [Puccinia sorghi]|uniref:Uncharacterized protein n=1 Tax=Puccinia sorghi TaxID=27349 RepID=A0A0L6V7X1_9BASI|nr:hypothetical protein VP01_2463g1 [Puccinia sorghi]